MSKRFDYVDAVFGEMAKPDPRRPGVERLLRKLVREAIMQTVGMPDREWHADRIARELVPGPGKRGAK